LKRIADVGFIGFPNAGKSTLLKALSKANPQISAAPFTTIRPIIGVIKFDDGRRIELADLPGLIERAHSGRGYGHQFLHMIERNSCHLMVVDINGFQLDANAPYRTAFETIVQLVSELELYNEVHSRYLHLY
jgi:Obg family GTPase CgtA